MFLIIFLVPIILFIILAVASKNKHKKYHDFYASIAANPSDSAVDTLIDFHQKNICIDEPNCWNQLRAVWFAINESPNVTTAKKTQLKSFLMLKGLTMHHKDAQIIDNYGK